MGQSLSSCFTCCCSSTEADVKSYAKASTKDKKPQLNEKNESKFEEETFLIGFQKL